MQTATAHVLTALYSLCHGIALTDREVEAIATCGHDLTPETWQRTGPALQMARDPDLDRGLAPHVLRWLSLEREASFTECLSDTALQFAKRSFVRRSRTARPCGRSRRKNATSASTWRRTDLCPGSTRC